MKRILSTTALTVLGASLVAGALALPAFAESSRDDCANRKEARVERMMERLDLNKDGNITVEEMATRRQTRFEQIDADKDGKITAAEFANAPRPGDDRAGYGKRADDDDRMKRRADRQGRMMARMDTDKDGAISQQEWNAVDHSRRLTRMDTNGDGIISRDEIANMPRKPYDRDDMGKRDGMGRMDGTGNRNDMPMRGDTN